MHTRSTRSRSGRAVAFVAALVLVASCGDDDDGGDADGTTTAVPATTSTSAATTAPAASATTLPVGDVPQRIVSLSPTHTEILFAIGAGDQLVAVDDFSNFPAEALELPNELSGFEPNVEAIAALEPDLVIIGGDFTGLGDQLDAVDIASWDGPAATTFDDTYAQIEQLGAATGHIAEAAELVANMQADIDAAIAAAPTPTEPLTYYHELDDQYFTVTSNTFIGEVYGLFGLVNIADGVEPGNDYPQLSAETIVSSDPALIFLACTVYCDVDATTVAQREGWSDMTAVQTGAVIELDDDVASRWGPRIVDFVEAVSASLTAVAVPAG